MKERVIGLMSGTSLDGIDIALTEIEWKDQLPSVSFHQGDTYPFPAELINKIRMILDETMCTAGLISSVHFELGMAYADVVERFCRDHEIDKESISLIGSHGQTIYHINQEAGLHPSSLQLGDGSVISTLTGIPVVSNFRNADIAVNGTGAPLVPFADYVLFQDNQDCISLHNIGGISNLTLLPKNRTLADIIAFDTGIGNMVMDEAMRLLYHQEYDEGGLIANGGEIQPDIVAYILSHPYFQTPPPKSTGREQFGLVYTKQLLSRFANTNKQDIIASITYATAQSIIDAYEQYILPQHDVRTIVFSGGGMHNTTLIDHIAQALPHIEIMTSDDVGINGNYKEAIAFALLGYCTTHHIPSNVPSATGATRRVILGQISYPTKGEY